MLKNKHIKKAIEETQEYSKGTKGAQNIEGMIKEMMKCIQNQKVQITVKRKQNIGVLISRCWRRERGWWVWPYKWRVCFDYLYVHTTKWDSAERAEPTLG